MSCLSLRPPLEAKFFFITAAKVIYVASHIKASIFLSSYFSSFAGEGGFPFPVIWFCLSYATSWSAPVKKAWALISNHSSEIPAWLKVTPSKTLGHFCLRKTSLENNIQESSAGFWMTWPHRAWANLWRPCAVSLRTWNDAACLRHTRSHMCFLLPFSSLL